MPSSGDRRSAALASLGESIDYDNFKNAVGERHGWGRERVYHRVWAALQQLQRP